MAIIDPFGSERIVGDHIELVPFEIIPSTVLDDDPTEVVSDAIKVPDGDAELVFLLNAAATLAPTGLTWQFLISYNGTTFFVYDGKAEDDWSEITIVTANLPDARAVIKGRVVAPYIQLKCIGNGTNITNYVTVDASVSRVPQAVHQA